MTRTERTGPTRAPPRREPVGSFEGVSASASQRRARVTAPALRARKSSKGEGEAIVCLTAYTARLAELLDPHCDLLLVGDSLGMVLYGETSTLAVGLERMIVHGRAVAGAAETALVVVDMPFGLYEESPEQAFRSAARVLSETGAQAVKLEGGAHMADTIRFLVARGVPVMGHVGLTPQAVNALGGFRARGRADEEERAMIARDAVVVSDAGAFAIVLEGVADDLAEEITRNTEAPIIGIGASAACDGQILVSEDMLGLTARTAKFVKRYADMGAVISDAAETYAAEVKARTFPGPEHVYKPKGR